VADETAGEAPASVVPTKAPRATEESTGPQLLRLGRRDRAEARRQLAALSPAEQALACSELRPARRDEFLMLIEHPEQVVPLLPAADLAVTIRATGMSEAAWLLELATGDQQRACLDVDCWTGSEVELPRVVEWIDALVEAGRPTLLRGLEELDAELWLLAMHHMSDSVIVGKEDEPPVGYFTVDGVVYFRGRTDEDFARVRAIAEASFSEAQDNYWRIVYGMVFEFKSECEEYAARWKRARLSDLGFPDLERAMRIYRPLAIEEVGHVDLGADDAPKGLVASGRLPTQLEGTMIGRALRELSAERAAQVLADILAVANSVAVADGMRLSEPESIPGALRKAVEGIDRGLAELAQVRGLGIAEVVEVTPVQQLFRIAATLDPELARTPPAREPYEDIDDEDPAAGEPEVEA